MIVLVILVHLGVRSSASNTLGREGVRTESSPNEEDGRASNSTALKVSLYFVQTVVLIGVSDVLGE